VDWIDLAQEGLFLKHNNETLDSIKRWMGDSLTSLETISFSRRTLLCALSQFSSVTVVHGKYVIVVTRISIVCLHRSVFAKLTDVRRQIVPMQHAKFQSNRKLNVECRDTSVCTLKVKYNFHYADFHQHSQLIDVFFWTSILPNFVKIEWPMQKMWAFK
jgi:hypothetical protein